MILEKLCKSNWFIIDVDNVSIELLSWDFMIEPDTLRNIIDYFCNIRLLNRDGEKIYSQKMIDRFSWLLSKRKRDIDYRERKPVSNIVIDVENTQSKVKESKVNNNILPNGNTTIVEVEKKEYTPTPQTQEINDMIEKVKNACNDAWVVYAPDPKERQYAKHLLSKKFEKDAIAPLKTDMDYFIKNVIVASAKRKYMKQIYNCQTLYYNRGSVINRIMLEKQEKTQKSNTSF